MKKEIIFIIIAATLFGLITVGGQFLSNLGLSLYEITLSLNSVIAIGTLIIAVFKRKFLIKKNMLRFFIFYGLTGALLQVTQYGGIALGVPVAVVILLIYTQPIWTILFGKMILKEKITKKKIITIIVAFAGVFILLKPWGVETVGSLGGIASALIAGVFLSLFIIYGKKSSIDKQHYITTAFGYSAFTMVWLCVLLPITSLFMHEPNLTTISFNFPTQYWFYIIFFGLIAEVIPRLLFYSGLEKVPASAAGVILLLEPISASIISAILFSQAITINIIFGGILILLSNYLIISEKMTE